MTQLFVNDAITGLSVSSDPYTSERLLIKSEENPYQALLGIQTGIFQCCGATEITHLAYAFQNEVATQNFVHKLYYLISEGTSYYMIAASYQLTPCPQGYTRTMDVLKNLGAHEVDVRPNRNHGPSNLHLFVWDPLYRKESGWDKYLKFYGSDTNPLWFDKLSVKEQQALIDGSKDKELRRQQEERARQERAQKVKLEGRKWDARSLIQSGEMNEHLEKMGYVKVKKKAEVGQMPLSINVPYGVISK
jgi:hypothetical protein